MKADYDKNINEEKEKANGEIARAEKEVDLLMKTIIVNNTDNKHMNDQLDYWSCALVLYRHLLKIKPDTFFTGSYVYIIKYLKKIAEGLPLTPIEDKDDEWVEIGLNPWQAGRLLKKGVNKKYQNKRLRCLFKDVYVDGHVEYHDNNRINCYDIITELPYTFGLANNVYDEIHPIKMPYDVHKEMGATVFMHTFLSDRDKENCDFDTVAILSGMTPDGEGFDIKRFFREPNENEEPNYGGWVEIDLKEFAERVQNANSNLTLEDLNLSLEEE